MPLRSIAGHRLTLASSNGSRNLRASRRMRVAFDYLSATLSEYVRSGHRAQRSKSLVLSMDAVRPWQPSLRALALPDHLQYRAIRLHLANKRAHIEVVPKFANPRFLLSAPRPEGAAAGPYRAA